MSRYTGGSRGYTDKDSETHFPVYLEVVDRRSVVRDIVSQTSQWPFYHDDGIYQGLGPDPTEHVSGTGERLTIVLPFQRLPGVTDVGVSRQPYPFRPWTPLALVFVLSCSRLPLVPPLSCNTTHV